MSTKAYCRDIYRQAFHDPDTVFEDLLFDTCGNYCQTLKAGGRVVSMLFALPCDITFENRTEDGIYIYAAATLKEYRGKGYMNRLLENVKSTTQSLIFLRPATEPLIGFYKKAGFTEIKTKNSTKEYPFVTPKLGYAELLSKTKISEDKEDFTVMYYSKSKTELKDIYFVNSME